MVEDAVFVACALVGGWLLAWGMVRVVVFVGDALMGISSWGYQRESDCTAQPAGTIEEGKPNG